MQGACRVYGLRVHEGEIDDGLVLLVKINLDQPVRLIAKEYGDCLNLVWWYNRVPKLPLLKMGPSLIWGTVI